jgi:WD40 repeat protein/serine/threonine protein kinase/tetratricopeptide (TPR) repeat protein
MDATPIDEEAIFQGARKIDDPASRQAYLDQSCGGDHGLRERLEALLRAYYQERSFLEAPPADASLTADVDVPPLTEGPGTVIGPYKLLEQIGEGGMGVVYMAEQTRPVRRKVALKIIKPGMDTKHVIARFEAERQALALMEHPNIARVLEAGTTESGRPYFVMELVRGILITDYCDRQKLSIPERLELFSLVCHAVQHAHQKGIIHRDIKPSNVLVTLHDGTPVPKVIDFGIAKATGQSLTDKTLYTGFAQLVGTPLYMSPEQAELSGLDVDTRSDVYSLGVLLYELLTSTTPFDKETFRQAAFDEIRRIIREQEPPRPSTRLSALGETSTTISANRQTDLRRLRKSLRGELDWIVMKALEKDRRRRYETPNALAADLRHYLNHEPVDAGPPSAWYRLQKSARRNRAVLATATVVATALVAVAVISVIYATEQARAKNEITGLAADLRKSLSQSERLLAIRNFERGRAACEQGEIGPGLLWMIESWRSAVTAGDTGLQRSARANLAAWRAHYPRLKMVLSHAAPIHAAAFSSDSRTVISGSLDGTAQLWDAASGKRIGSPLHQENGWLGVGFSPDGKTAWTTSGNNMVRLWDTTTGEPLGPPVHVPPQVHILAVAIKPDGQITLAGSEVNADNVARLWDAATSKPIGPPLTHRGHIFQPVFSPNGKIILTASDDGTARFWDAATGQPFGLPLNSPGGFRRAEFSPDGKAVLTGGLDGTAQLWDAATRKPFGLPMRHESEVRSMAFSSDGKTVLTGCQDKDARLWDAATGQFIGFLEHQGVVTAVAFSPDGKTILTGSADGTVRLWDADPGRPVGQVVEVPSMDRIGGVVGFGPHGKVLVSSPAEPNYQRCVQLWNGTTGQPIGARLPQPGGNHEVCFSSDGKVLLTTEADLTARFWDAGTGAALGVAVLLPGQPYVLGRCTRLGPDGKTILYVDKDRAVWICDWTMGTVRGHTQPFSGEPYAAEFSPDGKMFFTGLSNGEVRLWDAAKFTPLGDPILQPGHICKGLFSPDGKCLLIACEDGSVRLWDLAARKLRIPPIRGHQARVDGLAFSPDGKTIATGSRDETVRLWDTATGQPIGPTLRHTGLVHFVLFLAQGKSLLTGPLEFRLFPVAPDLPDEPERVATWVEVITGLRLDEDQGLVQVLDNSAWHQSRERLMQLGGPPETGPDQRLDPILFGPDPTARAKTFMERKQWDAAEAAFDEAMRARPFNITILLERGDLYARRGLWSEAAAYYESAVKQYPDVAPLHEQLAVTRILAGDLPGYRAACAAMLERFKAIDDSTAAVRVAYACSLAPAAVTDVSGLLQVSERWTRWVADKDLPGLTSISSRSNRWLATSERGVGAVLFRAGLPQDALERFERAHKVLTPRAWDLLLLAMIHNRLAHASDARRLLQQADQWIVEADIAPPGTQRDGPSWRSVTDRTAIMLLRREAEALLSADASFPADPFAP